MSILDNTIQNTEAGARAVESLEKCGVERYELTEGKCTLSIMVNGQWIEVETLGMIVSFRLGRNRAGEESFEFPLP